MFISAVECILFFGFRLLNASYFCVFQLLNASYFCLFQLLNASFFCLLIISAVECVLFFKLLNASCSESEDKDDDPEDTVSSQPSAAETKKKKKRKKKTGKKAVAQSSEDNLDLDEVEASLKWVENTLGPAPAVQAPKVLPAHPLKEVLGIENKHLNPENEMKKIFGSRVVQTENR